MLQLLSFDDFVVALDRWTGRTVSVRVVSNADDLIAVFRGELGQRSDEKHPALFWPLTAPPPAAHGLEKPGLYLHPEQFEKAAVHRDKTVLELRQDRVTLNIRRL